MAFSLPLGGVGRSGWQLLKRLTIVQPKEPKQSIGLDIGSTAVKVVVLGSRKALGPRVVQGHRVVEVGREADVSGAISRALAGFELAARAVNLSVSGQWVITRVVEMPKLAPAELAQALPFEAQRYLPFTVQDVVLDGAILGPSEGSKVWVLIVAAKRDLLQRRIDWIKQANLEPALVDVDALALANGYVQQSTGQPLTGSRALINVGSQVTNLVVLNGEVPYLLRDIPWGAEKLVRHTAEQLGVEEGAVAKQLQQGDGMPAPMLEAVKVATESLTVELQLSFDFFESRFGPAPGQLLVSGGLGGAPSFLEAVRSHVPQPVAAWAPSEGLSGQLAVAYGLALRSA